MVFLQKGKIRSYCHLMRLHQPVGIFLLLWPTLWGLLLANEGRLEWKITLIFILGVVVTRSAGCVINDIADRNFDGLVTRTKNRPLAKKEISVIESASIAVALIFAAALLVSQLNYLTLKISVVALFFIATYPYTKRFFSIPQVYLGITFSFGIPMAYAASLNFVPFEAILLMMANMFWVIAYDTEYAMIDREDDKHLGIKTSALLFGKRDVFFVFLSHGVFLSILCFIGILKEFRLTFFLLILVVLLTIFRQYFFIVGRKPEGCLKAFRQNNLVGFIILLIIAFEQYVT